ncbi:MAG: hypothetical protein IKC37_02275 [Clostridia bacterium]|nr:hypothetical protein [Clostridia bacterium]
MKIVHIAPSAPYNEGWGYQENLLTKYHQKLGNEVTLIISTFFHQDGKIVEGGEEDYVNADGVRIIRLFRKKYLTRALTNMHSEMRVYPILEEIRPDYIFFHGLHSTTFYQVVRYKKKINPACVVVQDNHLDYNIGTKCETIKEKVKCAFYRYHLRRTVRFVDKIYGVTPWRKAYAEDYFAAPKDKTDVLIMGADDEKIRFDLQAERRKEIREKYGVKEDEFFVVTGGKLDEKKKVRLLMQACKHLPKVKLLIFGSVPNEEKEAFGKLLSTCSNATYIGWIPAGSVYD